MAERDQMSRDLLNRLRTVMAGAGSTQSRLDRTTHLIAQGMGADACSCYVLRAGDVLELFSTWGLTQTAVHQTRLRVGEGLIGAIAASKHTIRVADVWADPRFVYRPETGEDTFLSLMGVPLVRGGQVIGVLAVQSRNHQDYTDVQLEVLETISMVLAEIVSTVATAARGETSPLVGNAVLGMRLEGTPLNGGVGMGAVVYHQPDVHVTRLVADDPEVELARLKTAIAEMRDSLKALFSSRTDLPVEYRDVMETFRMFAEDAGWVGRIQEHIQAGLSAEAAVRKVDNDMRLRLSKVRDAYIRERLHDLEDLANRLLRHLTGDQATSSQTVLPEHAILVCRTLGPAELLDYDSSRLRGVILESGTAGMHAVIIAKALDIPVIAQMPGIFQRVAPDDQVILDADHGQVFVRPNEDVRDAILDSIKSRQSRLATYHQLRAFPAQTRDGVTVSLMMNAGLMMDMDNLDACGADGVGLYRTEVSFMSHATLPDLDEQTDIYTQVLGRAGGKPVVFRTLDVGGDKLLPYWEDQMEENPAMGWRSTRITLARPAILRQQLRALIRAAAGRDELRVMFPMIATVPEYRAARLILDRELAREQDRGTRLPKRVFAGSMVEVPSLLWQLPCLFRERIDFLSVGSNDLLQFIFASDRGNPRIAGRYDALSPPVFHLLREIVDAADRASLPVSICGEMASRPLDAVVLAALGFRTLSVTSSAIGPVKQAIRSVTMAELDPFVRSMGCQPADSQRARIRAFAHDHNFAID